MSKLHHQLLKRNLVHSLTLLFVEFKQDSVNRCFKNHNDASWVMFMKLKGEFISWTRKLQKFREISQYIDGIIFHLNPKPFICEILYSFYF